MCEKLTEAERAYWREKEAGNCKNDRGGYYADGFLDGYRVALADRAASTVQADDGLRAALERLVRATTGWQSGSELERARRQAITALNEAAEPTEQKNNEEN